MGCVDLLLKCSMPLCVRVREDMQRFGIYSSQKKNKVCILYIRRSLFIIIILACYIVFLDLTATKLVRLWINCKIWNGFSLSRLENKIVGGFRLFNIVKMLLFTTTFCRSTHLNDNENDVEKRCDHNISRLEWK